MRIFCLTTGRSGSTTFAKAMAHANNFTSGHETRLGYLGAARLDYPEWHAEADNRLAWMLGSLEKRFADEPTYVHLTRDRDELVKSLSIRYHSPSTPSIVKSVLKGRLPRSHFIMDAFGYGIVVPGQTYDGEGWTRVAEMFVDVVTDNISGFLRGKSKVIEIKLEEPEQSFARLWDTAQVQGDFEAAVHEWSIRHNAGPS